MKAVAINDLPVTGLFIEVSFVKVASFCGLIGRDISRGGAFFTPCVDEFGLLIENNRRKDCKNKALWLCLAYSLCTEDVFTLDINIPFSLIVIKAHG